MEHGLSKKNLLWFVYYNKKTEFKKYLDKFWPNNISELMKIRNIISKIYVYIYIVHMGKYINFIVIYGNKKRLFMKNQSLGNFKINFSDVRFRDDEIIFNENINKIFDKINIKYELHDVDWLEKIQEARIVSV